MVLRAFAFRLSWGVLSSVGGAVLVQSNVVVCHGGLEMVSCGGDVSMASTLVPTHFKPLQEMLVFSHGEVMVLHAIASILLSQAPKIASLACEITNLAPLRASKTKMTLWGRDTWPRPHPKGLVQPRPRP